MRRTLVVVPLLALIAAGMAACGDDDGPSAVRQIRTASAATLEAGSVTMTTRTSFEGPGGETIEIDGDGEFDFASETGRLTMTLPEAPGIPAGAEVEQLFAGTEIFLRSELLFGPLPDGADWVRFDLAEVTEQEGGVDITQLQGFTSDPTSGLATLEAVAEDDIEDLGEEEVAGVSTTHYRAEINLRRAYEEADAVTNRERFEALLDTVGDTLTTDVWIDDEGRARRQTLPQQIPTTPGQTTEGAFTVELTSFGEPVEIDLPEDADTIDLQDLLRQRGEG